MNGEAAAKNCAVTDGERTGQDDRVTGGSSMTQDAEAAASWLADQYGLRYVDLSQAALAPGAATLLPEQLARQVGAVPMGRRLGTPVIAVTDPGDVEAMDALRDTVGREFVAVVARPDHIAQATSRLYAPPEPSAPPPPGPDTGRQQVPVWAPAPVPSPPGAPVSGAPAGGGAVPPPPGYTTSAGRRADDAVPGTPASDAPAQPAGAGEAPPPGDVEAPPTPPAKAPAAKAAASSALASA
ncbi:MAG: hypothetical protein ACRDYZ_07245, partial [Acidimicrobiales bacterium]